MKAKRIIMSFIGVIITAVSVGIFKLAAFGTDPFQSLMSGLDMLIPISFGTLYVIVNMLLLIFSLIFDRHNIGFATFVNMFLLGYITEYTVKLLNILFPAPSLLVRAVALVIGVVTICLGLALYMTADLGVSTYDAVSLVLANKWKVARFGVCRIITDIVCVIAGAVLFLIAGGAPSDIPTVIGIGTIITAFFMGPLIELFSAKLVRPMLYGRGGAAEAAQNESAPSAESES